MDFQRAQQRHLQAVELYLEDLVSMCCHVSADVVTILVDRFVATGGASRMAQWQLLLSSPVASENLLVAAEDGFVSCEGDLLFSSPLGLHFAEEAAEGFGELRLELLARQRLPAATSVGQGGR